MPDGNSSARFYCQKARGTNVLSLRQHAVGLRPSTEETSADQHVLTLARHRVLVCRCRALAFGAVGGSAPVISMSAILSKTLSVPYLVVVPLVLAQRASCQSVWSPKRFRSFPDGWYNRTHCVSFLLCLQEVCLVL